MHFEIHWQSQCVGQDIRFALRFARPASAPSSAIQPPHSNWQHIGADRPLVLNGHRAQVGRGNRCRRYQQARWTFRQTR